MTGSADYKAHISGVFTRASTTYDHVGPPFFSYFGRRLVDFASIPLGSKVLDVACGRGASLFSAAEAVSATGEVVGIDLSEGMIDQTQQEIRRRQIKHAQVFVMDAEDLKFSASRFDCVLCGLCLFFFPDLGRALGEYHRVLRTGGFIVASTFRKPIDDELEQDWQDLRKSFEDRANKVPEVETSELDTAPKMKRQMLQAGFAHVEVRNRTKTFYYQDLEEWWQTAWSHGQRRYLERLAPNDLTEFKARAFEILRKRETERGIPYRWGLLFTRAQKP